MTSHLVSPLSCREARNELLLAESRDRSRDAALREHLSQCPSCRAFRRELRESMSALATGANDEPHATFSSTRPSQWPAVKRHLHGERGPSAPRSPRTVRSLAASLMTAAACGLLAMAFWPIAEMPGAVGLEGAHPAAQRRLATGHQLPGWAPVDKTPIDEAKDEDEAD